VLVGTDEPFEDVEPGVAVIAGNPLNTFARYTFAREGRGSMPPTDDPSGA
jgi:hypothetical protein